MKVAIVRYNAGNIRSVLNALHRLGVEPILTDDAEELRSADRVLFPGQGEAATAMRYLREHHLDRVITDLRNPVLGICVGQQLLCRHSEEGDTACLGSRLQAASQFPRRFGIKNIKTQPLLLQGNAFKVTFDSHGARCSFG